MVLRVIGISFIALFFISAGVSVDVSIQNGKKINRTLKAIWPDDEFESVEMTSQHLLPGERAYEVKVNGVTEAYFLTAQARSKFDVFDFMLVFDTEGVIIEPKILVYREDYGGEIASKRWLRQFIGMSKEDQMALGKDIRNVAGATISCEAASLGFKDASTRIADIINEQR